MSAIEINNDLKKLPLRALLAYMVRCIRRVQPLYSFPAQHPAAAVCVTAIDTALELVERFAAGDDIDAPTLARIEEATVCALMAAGQTKSADPAAAYVANAAYAATCALKTVIDSRNDADPQQAAESAAESAVTAIDAATAANPEIADAAKFDWEMLHRMRLGTFPELGKAINPSEAGILGPLSPPSQSTKRAVANSPNIAPESFDAPPADEFESESAASVRPAPGRGIDPEGARKLEMLASMIRTKQKELQQERAVLEAEKQAFAEERAAFESQSAGQPAHSNAVGGETSVSLAAEQGRLAEERAKCQTERKNLEAERANLMREKADLVQQEADLHKELRKLQDERKRQEPKEDALRTLSRQQAAQNTPAHVQELLAQLHEERQRLKTEKEQLAEVLALVNSGCFKPPKAGKARKSRRSSPADGPRLRMILEPGAATPAQMSELFRELSTLRTDLGGAGIRFLIEDARIWNVAKMANRKRSTNDVERSFVEVHIVADVGSPGELNLAVWGRFASSLYMALRLDAGLASYFDLSESAPKEHKVWKLAADAAKRAAESGSRKSNSDQNGGTGGLLIDALNSRMRRIEELRRQLEHKTGLVLELLPEQECDDEEPAAPPVAEPAASAPPAVSTTAERSPGRKQASGIRTQNRSKLVAISLAAVGAAILVAVLCLK